MFKYWKIALHTWLWMVSGKIKLIKLLHGEYESGTVHLFISESVAWLIKKRMRAESLVRSLSYIRFHVKIDPNARVAR